MANYYPTNRQSLRNTGGLDFQIPSGVGPDLLGDFLRKRKAADKGGGSRRRGNARPKVSGFRVAPPKVDLGYALKEVAPYALAFELGYFIGWVIFQPPNEAGWTEDQFAGWGVNPCGGHSPATIQHVVSHLAAIGTGFAGNCSFTWPIDQGVNPDGTMTGFEGTKTGNLRAMWRVPTSSPPNRLRLCSILTAPAPAEPWPEMQPARPARPFIVRAPSIAPSIDPAAAPIGWPMEIPHPIPYRRIPQVIRPAMPDGSPSSGYAPPVVYEPEPEVPRVAEPGVVIPIWGGGTGGNTTLRPRGRQRPRRREKEKKTRFRNNPVLEAIIGNITEGLDNLMCVNKGLPGKRRAKPKWVPGGELNWRWHPTGWRKERGSYRAPTAIETAQAIYKNIDDLDVGKVLICLTENQIEDTLFGMLGDKLKKASRYKTGGVGGWTTGPWDTAFMQHLG